MSDYLSKNADLANLAEELALDAKQTEILVRWHRVRSPQLGDIHAFHTMMRRAGVLSETLGVRTLVKLPLDEMIADSIACYPTLFLSRTAVLEHMFIVLGCGYEWCGGQLITYKWTSEIRRIPIEAARIIGKVREHINNPYPWSQMNNLATMPGDALPEWRAAGDEVRAALEAQNYSFVDNIMVKGSNKSDPNE